MSTGTMDDMGRKSILLEMSFVVVVAVLRMFVN